MKSGSWQSVFVPLILVLGVWVIYWQTGGFELLAYDDAEYTVGCPFVKDGLTLSNVGAAFSNFTYGGIWMPLTWISYMMTSTFFGEGAQHWVNVVFHSVNVILLWCLLMRICNVREDFWKAAAVFAAVAFWAWHPQRVESVAWIASRKDTVFTMFTLLGLLAWHGGRCGLGLLAMLAACMSKPTAMCFPFLALAVDILSVRRIRWKWYAPLFVLAAGVGGLTMYSQSCDNPGGLYYGTFAWRLMNGTVALGLQLWHSVIPEGLHFWYRPTAGEIPLDAAKGFCALAVATFAFAIALWKCQERRRLLLACALWYLAAIGPTLGVAGSFGNHAYADRFTYVPAMAASLLAAAWLGAFRPKALVPALLAVSAAMGAVAFWYAGTFRDNERWFSRTLACDPGHAYAWLELGNARLLKYHDVEGGLKCIRKSLSLVTSETAKEQLAITLALRGNPADFGEIEGLLASTVADPASDRQGKRLEALVMVAMGRHDLMGAMRYLSALANCEDRELAAKARVKLAQLRTINQ